MPGFMPWMQTEYVGAATAIRVIGTGEAHIVLVAAPPANVAAAPMMGDMVHWEIARTTKPPRFRQRPIEMGGVHLRMGHLLGADEPAGKTLRND
jgi:hypothetical protein